MKYMIKPIVSNILLLIEAILLSLITLIFVSKITILNEKYIIKKMAKTNYYDQVYDEIKDDMAYITRKSGFSSRIIDDIFKKEDLKKDINNFIKQTYKNEKNVINVELLKENLNKNLEEYLEEKGLEITETDKKTYINKITTTYKNRVNLMNYLDSSSKALSKLYKSNNSFIVLFIIDLIVLIGINKKIFRKKEYNVLTFTSALTLIGISIFIKTININNLFIYNIEISNLIKAIIQKFTNISFLIAIIYIIAPIMLKKYIKNYKNRGIFNK